MIGDIKAHVTSAFNRFGIDIVLYIEDGMRRSVGIYNEDTQAYEYFEHKPGQIIPPESRLCLSEDEALALYIGLSERFNPPEASATAQKLEAVQDHMEHISTILDRVLPAVLKCVTRGNR